MSAIKTISQRRSSPKLTTPAPDTNEIETILAAALCAPDHGQLRPWRFLVVEGGARIDLGDLFLKAALAESWDLSPERQSHIKKLPLRAPQIIVAVAKPVEDHKVPVLEQLVATGAAVQNMCLAVEELGYGAMWRTGEMAYNPIVKSGLGLDPEDQIIAFLYLGTAELKAKPRVAQSLEQYCSHWAGSN